MTAVNSQGPISTSVDIDVRFNRSSGWSHRLQCYQKHCLSHGCRPHLICPRPSLTSPTLSAPSGCPLQAASLYPALPRGAPPACRRTAGSGAFSPCAGPVRCWPHLTYITGQDPGADFFEKMCPTRPAVRHRQGSPRLLPMVGYCFFCKRSAHSQGHLMVFPLKQLP